MFLVWYFETHYSKMISHLFHLKYCIYYNIKSIYKTSNQILNHVMQYDTNYTIGNKTITIIFDQQI